MMRGSLCATGASIAVALGVVCSGAAQVINEDLKILRPDAAANDQFGIAVAISGTTAVVGATQNSTNGFRSGAAYVYNASTSGQVSRLAPLDFANEDFFGASVGVSGSRVIVGSWADDDGGSRSGSAYIFDAFTGFQVHKLTASDAAADDFFGQQVAISGTTAIAGAWGNDDSGSNSGSAYLFNATTGVQTFKLLPSDAAASDQFGHAVGVGGSRAIVGAFRNDDSGTDSGAAYIFDTATGSQTLKLLPADGATDDFFGASVAIGGNVAIVGAHGDDDNGSSSGSAYLFNATTGAQLFKLTAPDGAAGHVFGWSVGISSDGTHVAVGARGASPNGASSGVMYVFQTSNGALTGTLTPPDNAAGDQFGISVAIDGLTVIGGASGDDDNGSSSGSARVFDATSGSVFSGKLVPKGGVEYDRFGTRVAMDATMAVVTASRADPQGTDSGAAYVFDASTGQRVAQLLPSDGSPGGLFGVAAAIDAHGNVVAVGAVDETTSAGTAYLFAADTGLQLAQLDPGEPDSQTRLFGSSVDAAGSSTAVGAPEALSVAPAIFGGAVYLFTSPSSIAVDKLVPSDSAHLDRFGWSVAITDETLVVGAIGDDDLGLNAGSVYVFDLATGTEMHKLLPSVTPGAGGLFGSDVAIDGNTIAVGAPNTSDGGAVYVFDADTGAERFVLRPPPGAPFEFFGINVDVSGSTIVVGADGDATNGTNSGAAHLYDAFTGQQIATLLPSDGAPQDFFGTVAISGDRVIVGARAADVPSLDAGAAYVFTVPEVPCPGDFNGDDEVDVLDFLDFFDAFGQCENQPAPCPSDDVNADVNGDTSVDILDFLDFLDAFGAGACP